jgi:hypothetical protein
MFVKHPFHRRLYDREVSLNNVNKNCTNCAIKSSSPSTPMTCAHQHQLPQQGKVSLEKKNGNWQIDSTATCAPLSEVKPFLNRNANGKVNNFIARSD